jgi:hypothetical protein
MRVERERVRLPPNKKLLVIRHVKNLLRDPRSLPSPNGVRSPSNSNAKPKSQICLQLAAGSFMLVAGSLSWQPEQRRLEATATPLHHIPRNAKKIPAFAKQCLEPRG